MKNRQFPPKNKKEEHRINRQIKAQQVRLVIEGEGARIVSLQEALKIAEEKGLDLVEVSPNQDPPVCKIMDYGKWKFDQSKRKKEQQKKQHVIEVKELKLGPNIGDHDYQIKLKKAIEFLQEGNKVRLNLKFKGRQLAYPELGMEIINRFLSDTQDYATIEIPPKMDGKQILAVIAPKHKK
ncbi:MAG: translation initiation factor IF-3 [Leptospiraceae bacterium]|nr:translation initiation factor IF-3 [Leptospiraceae bacterium]MDW7975929.1 translation initiation factor IF-3 [Leptospiraceae bacterium]